MVMQLTRLKAGHYIFGHFIIRRHITEESTYWTLEHGDIVEVVPNFARAKEQLIKLAEEKYGKGNQNEAN